LFFPWQPVLLQASQQLQWILKRTIRRPHLVVPQHVVTKAKFPFIDIHVHQYTMESQNLAGLVKVMDTLNMAVMVNLSGSYGK
jgi:hypothetical protein